MIYAAFLVTISVSTVLTKAVGKIAQKSNAVIERRKKDSQWYDSVYECSEAYRCHYSQSRYYFLWSVIADRIRRSPNRMVLEIGCGSGQLAELLHDQGIVDYVAFDFSPAAIQLARQAVPQAVFFVTDARTSELVTNGGYDGVVCTEVLEHIVDDLTVVQRVPAGKKYIVTVPNFRYRSQVRYFSSGQAVADLYASLSKFSM